MPVAARVRALLTPPATTTARCLAPLRAALTDIAIVHESELPPTGYAKIMITEDGQPAVLKAGALGGGLG